MKIETKEGRIFSTEMGQTILDAAVNNGLYFEYSCKTGQCGVCVTQLLAGKVIEIQPQLALTEGDRVQNKVLTCCCEAQTDVLIDAEDLTALKGIEIKTLPVRIKSIELKAQDIVGVILRFPPTAQFKFLEGQYIDVIGPRGLRRSYSIASMSGSKELTLLIKRFENGAMSEYWFNEAVVNDLLRIEGPKGTFYVRNMHVPLVFLATGTGIAPIISILNRMDQEGFKQDFFIKVYWGNRNPDEFVWEPFYKNIKVEFICVLSRENECWNGDVGYIQNIALNQIDFIENVHVYACGSNEMIKTSKQMFVEKGLKSNCFYSDAFVQSF